MIYTTVKRKFYIIPGVTCVCEIPIPDLAADPTQANAMGKSISEKEENLDQFLTEILFPQYTSALKRAVASYQISGLPEKFLHGHTVNIVPMPFEFPASYHILSDIISIDPDLLVIGCRLFSGRFAYGHEFGHRIMNFRKDQLDSAISTVCSILAISDTNFATEILADAFGDLISGGDKSRFDVIDPEKQEGLRLTALKLAWSC